MIALALQHARGSILTMGAVYALSVGMGMVMVHAGLPFALERRDAIVAAAHRADPASKADDRGDHATAALLDFSRNLLLAAVPDTVGGLVLVLPIATAVYRGWVGGLVSVDARHESRLRHLRSATYYCVTMVLQLSGFILAGGAGLHLGWAFLRRRGSFVGPKWFALPKAALIDVATIYTLIVPLFLLGSLWEFLS